MRDYPAISGSNGQDFQEFDAHVFDKLDGSNLRAELNPKRGFYKFGTRNRLFDKTDQVFGRAVDLFKLLWEDKFLKLANDKDWDSVVIFCEFWGAAENGTITN